MLDPGRGSLFVLNLAVPADGPSNVFAALRGVLTVRQLVLTACHTGARPQTATIMGVAAGHSQ